MEFIIEQTFSSLVPLALLMFGLVSYVVDKRQFKPTNYKDYNPEDWGLEDIEYCKLVIKDVQYFGGKRRNIVYEIRRAGDVINRGAKFISADTNPFDKEQLKKLFSENIQRFKFAHKYQKIEKADTLTAKVYKHRNDNWTDAESTKFQRLLKALDERVDKLESIDFRSDVDWSRVEDLYHDIDQLCDYFERNYNRTVYKNVEVFDKSTLRTENEYCEKEAVFFNIHVKKLVKPYGQTQKAEPALS